MACMPTPQSSKIQEEDLVGFKYFKKIHRLLDTLHSAGCERDRAHNRQLHMDQYTTLLLLYFFNPILTSLRGIQQASELKKVQRKLGVPRASLGSLSEAARVFDSELIQRLIGELADQVQPMDHDPRLDQVQGVLTLVDGTLLSALPKLTEAMWSGSSGLGVKLHTHFELLKAVPISMKVADGGSDERAALNQSLLPDRVYVMDRGYASFKLFSQIQAAGSSLVCRVRDNSVYDVLENLPLTDADRAAKIHSDQRVAMNQGKACFRLIKITCTPHPAPQASQDGPGRPGARPNPSDCDRSDGPTRRGGRPDLPASLGDRDLLPLLQAHLGLSAPAESVRQWDRTAGVQRDHRVSVDRVVDGQEADASHL